MSKEAQYNILNPPCIDGFEQYNTSMNKEAQYNMYTHT